MFTCVCRCSPLGDESCQEALGYRPRAAFSTKQTAAVTDSVKIFSSAAFTNGVRLINSLCSEIRPGAHSHIAVTESRTMKTCCNGRWPVDRIRIKQLNRLWGTGKQTNNLARTYMMNECLWWVTCAMITETYLVQRPKTMFYRKVVPITNYLHSSYPCMKAASKLAVGGIEVHLTQWMRATSFTRWLMWWIIRALCDLLWHDCGEKAKTLHRSTERVTWFLLRNSIANRKKLCPQSPCLMQLQMTELWIWVIGVWKWNIFCR